MINGDPIIIDDGKLSDEVLKAHSSFYNANHARTVLGLKANGEIIICVIEHIYKQALSDIKLSQIITIIKEKNLDATKISADEIINILQNYFSIKNEAIGISLKELAVCMLKENCIQAINLDGEAPARYLLMAK